MTIFKASGFRAIAAAAALCAGTVAQATVVDLFTDPPGGQSVTDALIDGVAATNQNAVAYPATIVGGYRDLSINKLTDNFGLPTQGDAALSVGGGALTLDNATGVTSVGVVTWDGSNVTGGDGVGVATTGLGGVDFTSGGALHSFLATVLYADLGFDYKIRVWDMGGHYSELAASVQFPIGSAYNSFYAFDWFNLGNGRYCEGNPYSPPPDTCNPASELDFTITRGGVAGNVDFTKIGALQLVLSNDAAHASADFALASIESVPEPGVLALVGIAMVGGAAVSRRRRVAE